MDKWLPAIIQNSSTKSLPLSLTSSLAAPASGFLDEDDLEDVVRFQVMTFVTCRTGSKQTMEIYVKARKAGQRLYRKNPKGKENIRKKLLPKN